LFTCRSSVTDDGFFVAVAPSDDVDHLSPCSGNTWGFVTVLLGAIVPWICARKAPGGVSEVAPGPAGRPHRWPSVAIGKFRRLFDGALMYLKNVPEKI
jgi:hypothetical protein